MFASGCGGTGETDHSQTGAGRASSTAGSSVAPSSTAAKGSPAQVGQRDIDSYVLSRKEVPGYSITAMQGRTPEGDEEPVSLSKGTVFRISPFACQPFFANVGSESSAYPQYGLAVDIVADDTIETTISLAAYRPGDAPRVLADLRQSAASCSGWAGPVDKAEKYGKPQLEAAPRLGDEAVEYKITENITEDDGKVMHVPYVYVTVRKGSTVAAFQVRGLPDKPPKVPTAMIKAQIAKVLR
ncbi:hypothetical protein [Actinacidiphila sp. bgisy144]|uniref:hypothetical protein n=1 Tax=Actinacidiphila sp. bgisy144 TaxID=3413791 RepID=UPI003EBB3020